MVAGLIFLSGLVLWILEKEKSSPKPQSSVPTDREEAQKRLSHVKTAVLYERFSDVRPKRTLEEQTQVINATQPGLIFRAWFMWGDFVNTCEEGKDAQSCYNKRKSFEHLENATLSIKGALPNTIIVGGLTIARIANTSYDPVTRQFITYPETWDMALDPAKWGITTCNNKQIKAKWGVLCPKIEYQCRFAKGAPNWYEGDCINYTPGDVEGYFPDITNPKFQEFFQHLAQRSIDAGADAIWVDLFWHQARKLADMTGNENDLSVIETLESLNKTIKDIHDYGVSKGKYVYVGSWFSTKTPPSYKKYVSDLDFLTINLGSPEEILSMNMNETYWANMINASKEIFPNTPIFVFLDWGWGAKLSPLGAFSQKLTSDKQNQFLRIADTFFSKKGIIFVYPLHGGGFGQNPVIRAYGKYNLYDALAPEFQTYETIKELAQKKAKKENNN